MTALVVSINNHSLGGPSFGDYCRHNDEDEDEDDEEEGSQPVLPTSSVGSLVSSPASLDRLPTNDLQLQLELALASTVELPPLMDASATSACASACANDSAIEGMPRSRYSLDEGEEDDHDDDQATFLNFSAVSPPIEPVAAEHESNDDDDEDGDMIPSLNDMVDALEEEKEEETLETTPPMAFPLDESVGDVWPNTTGTTHMEEEMVVMESTSSSASEDPVSTSVSVSVSASLTALLPYAGLDNLGNTCYLNSALQLLKSLDQFTYQLHSQEPQHKESALRQALVDVLQQLQSRNSTDPVRPHAFKTQVDERSSLFVGYRQQDAHEFLTTLLDLVDEDYKALPPPLPLLLPLPLEESKEDDTMTTFEGNDGMDECASPVKKPRLEDEGMPMEVSMPDEEEEQGMYSIPPQPTLSTSQSFKDLQFDDIENLLHGDGPTLALSPSTVCQDTNHVTASCKLVGGRMSTVGVPSTRLENMSSSSAVAAVSVAASSMSSSSSYEGTSGVEVQPVEEKKPFSPIDDTFTTQVRVCLTCDSCKYRRSHTETYLHFSLEIGPTIGSVEEALRAFFKSEKREIKCEKCFCETALQTNEITQLPKAFLFHLKRFIVDVSSDYTSISYRKDQSPVSFDSSLVVNEEDGILGEVLADEVILPRGVQYGIRSVVHHIGSSASCGHYKADSFRQAPGQIQDRDWIRFNDEYVTKVTATEAIENATTTAYMILYELEPHL